MGIFEWVYPSAFKWVYLSFSPLPSIYSISTTTTKSRQLCLTLCNPMVCSLPGSSIHGILQARILEWVAMPFPRGSSQPKDRICISYVSLLFFGTLHSDGCIFPFLICLSLLFFFQLFVKPPQATILPFCISFSWGWS